MRLREMILIHENTVVVQRDTVFELPELTEKDGFSLMEFPYIPDTEGTMMPEAEQGE